jgi:hypothetical protein
MEAVVYAIVVNGLGAAGALGVAGAIMAGSMALARQIDVRAQASRSWVVGGDRQPTVGR